MSSIRITSQLHEAWRRRTHNWSTAQAQALADAGGTRAPRPSTVEPPPEEFDAIVRSMIPFYLQGMPVQTWTAILSATSAPYDVADETLLPVHYLNSQSLNCHRSTVLSWPSNYCGAAYVCEELFPLSRHLESAARRQTMLNPWPAASVGQVSLLSYDGCVLLPRRVPNIQAVPQEDVEFLHGREATRPVGSPVSYIAPFWSTMLYTGCVRPATASEITHLFDTIIRPDDWLKIPQSFVDFFSLCGVDDGIVSQARIETEQSSVTPRVTPQAESATNVPAPASRARTPRVTHSFTSGGMRNSSRGLRRTILDTETIQPTRPPGVVGHLSPAEMSRIADELLSDEPADAVPTQHSPQPQAPLARPLAWYAETGNH